MKLFNYYEIIGVAVPGAAFILGIAIANSKMTDIILSKDFGVANLGVFIIISYVAGQFIQAFGNLLENVYWWFLKGMPTDWIRTGKRLLSQEQVCLLESKIKSKLNLSEDIGTLDKQQWYSVTRQLYAYIQKNGDLCRVDRFNANYGLNRGITTATLLAGAIIVIMDHSNWKLSLLSMVIAVVFLYRMQRFGKNYARELFVQFLEAS